MGQSDKDWWRHGIFYQIYPRSFEDSDGDGVGDLKGIIARLPYLKSLGIDAVWLSPIFPSPMADFGYDISDYTGIDPLFGSMKDFDALVNVAHENGLKLILDLVPNHTSDQHPWFVEARSSRDNRSATGTSGVIRPRMAARRTTGCRNSAAVRGSTTRRPGNITTTRFSPHSRI
jgi:alpha-glucosidase